MKKSLFILFSLFAFSLQANCATYNPQSKVPSIGADLLAKNGIAVQNIKFEVTSKTVDNSTFAQDRTVSIPEADLTYTGNDNEVAAVIANELGHIIAGHGAKEKIFSSMITTPDTTNSAAGSIISNYADTKAQKEADVIAVNLMANAGYNPLASIVVLTKQTQTAWNAILGKPANADRAMNIYDYTAYAYPDKLKAGYKCNEYTNFLTYANTVLEERNASKKLQKKSQKEMQKYRKNSVSQISKFKTRGALSGWDAAYGLLNGN